MLNKRIVLGVSGGIAAYKVAELIRLLRRGGAEVRVVMTEAAEAFIGVATFQALSGNPVRSSLFDPAEEAQISHIELARWADHVIIVPCTANTLAKLAQGVADSLLTTLYLAAKCPVAVVPAMNTAMWEHPATAHNVARLKSHGVRVLGPAEGEQACGEKGLGRMLEPVEIVARLDIGTAHSPGSRGTMVITAGPTFEDLDPVRFLGNNSSGKMGFAIARAARDAGFSVVLISGPVHLADPEGVTTVHVRSAAQMLDRVMEHVDSAAVFVASAAVADYRPVVVAEKKIKKGDDRRVVELEKTVDIVGTVARLKAPPLIVGFAAETDELEKNAQKKIQEKGLHMIAANHVGRERGGFNSDENRLFLFWRGGKRDTGWTSKVALGKLLIKQIIRLQSSA